MKGCRFRYFASKAKLYHTFLAFKLLHGLLCGARLIPRLSAPSKWCTYAENLRWINGTTLRKLPSSPPSYLPALHAAFLRCVVYTERLPCSRATRLHEIRGGMAISAKKTARAQEDESVLKMLLSVSFPPAHSTVANSAGMANSIRSSSEWR